MHVLGAATQLFSVHLLLLFLPSAAPATALSLLYATFHALLDPAVGALWLALGVASQWLAWQCTTHFAVPLWLALVPGALGFAAQVGIGHVLAEGKIPRDPHPFVAHFTTPFFVTFCQLASLGYRVRDRDALYDLAHAWAQSDKGAPGHGPVVKVWDPRASKWATYDKQS